MVGVRGESQRWQGPKSSFPWEQEAPDYIRELMPDAEPYRAWQTFTFTAATGHVRELDVPKERFISYPDASPDSDSGFLLIGWAGWDHREQAAALISLIEDRSQTDGLGHRQADGFASRPAGNPPWVRQWRNDLDPAYGTSPADAFDAYLTAQRESRGLTEESLFTWIPANPSRARRK